MKLPVHATKEIGQCRKRKCLCRFSVATFRSSFSKCRLHPSLTKEQESFVVEVPSPVVPGLRFSCKQKLFS